MESFNVVRMAEQLCQRDLKFEACPEIEIQPPSSNINPVWPPLSWDEYEMLEKDTAKYFLYYTAMIRALEHLCALDIVKRNLLSDALSLKILILGCGHGRLVTLALDAVQTVMANCFPQVTPLPFEVHALDANPEAVDFCRRQFASDPRVRVHDPFCLVEPWCHDALEDWPASLLAERNAFDLIVSEVLGSFGDSEFLPEIAAAAAASLARPHAAAIPRAWRTYLAPLASPCAAAHVARDPKGAQAMYVMTLPADARFLAPCREAYSGVCPAAPAAGGRPADAGAPAAAGGSTAAERPAWNAEARLVFRVAGGRGADGADGAAADAVTGLAGYFTAELWGDVRGDVVLDSRAGSDTRNTFHWQTFYLPLPAPVRVGRCRGAGPGEGGDGGGLGGDGGARDDSDGELVVGVRRRCVWERPGRLGMAKPAAARYRMWYEWCAAPRRAAPDDAGGARAIGGTEMAALAGVDWINAGGLGHSLWLTRQQAAA